MCCLCRRSITPPLSWTLLPGWCAWARPRAGTHPSTRQGAHCPHNSRPTRWCPPVQFNNLFLKRDISMRFWTLFFHTLVVPVPSPLIHTLKYFHHLLWFHWVIFLKKKLACIKHGSFLIFVFQYTHIFESLCIETWILENMKSFALQNLRV